MNNSRGDLKEVIIEEFIAFHSEITLLTVTQQNGETLYCPPIGHQTGKRRLPGKLATHCHQRKGL